MGASCQGPKAYTGEFELKLDPNIELPQSIDVIKKNTISLAVPAPCFYRTRRFRFAGRSRAGYSGEDKPHINQDNLLYYNFRRLFLHIFIILDGNGPDGDLAAFFVKEKLLIQLSQVMQSDVGPNLEDTLKRMFAKVDEELQDQEDIDVRTSGVTLVVAILDETSVTIANCGDCRAVLGCHNGKKKRLRVEALSTDHTLRVAAERERCTSTGAIIRTLAQLEGKQPLTPQPDWDMEIGVQIDLSGDPPRLFEEKLHPNEPAVAFTRAMGCGVAKACGVISTPEVRKVNFDEDSRLIVLGSNGVFEFITNQEVIDFAARHYLDPAAACEDIVDTAYRLWWQVENQIDDITIMVIAIDRIEPVEEPPPSESDAAATDSATEAMAIAEDTEDAEAAARAAKAAAAAEAGPVDELADSDVAELSNGGRMNVDSDLSREGTPEDLSSLGDSLPDGDGVIDV